MSRIQLFPLFFMLSAICVQAEDFPAQSINYEIRYHCMFIDEAAAHATVNINDFDGTYYATLNGRSRPIGETIYCINDTLQSTFVPSGETLRPASENVLYMSGYYRKPHEGDYTDPYAVRSYRNIDGGGLLSASHATMECVQLTADMLCIFYYAKTEDFSRLPQGQPIDVPVTMPNGYERTMQIVSNGVQDFNGREAYNLTVNYTYGAGLSQYPITVMIDTEWLIPVQFAATIDIGEVQMNYVY